MSTKIHGQIVKVGDAVGFKSDVEQYGIITRIAGDTLYLKAPEGQVFHGNYIGGNDTTTVHACECWLD